MEIIGTKIQLLRKCRNMTQSELAEVLDVSPQSVSKWENHISAPDISLLPIIAQYFGITMDELFNYRLDALNYKERFIRFMADNGVLCFGEFKLQSGRISPYFINTGNYRSASQIARLSEFYAECIREHNVHGNLLTANTSKEIPIMIGTSITLFDRYGIDMKYRINTTVGKPLEGHDRLVLIKDTLTSGNTLRINMDTIQHSSGAHATDIIVSVDRMEKGMCSLWSARKEIEKDYNVRIHAIVTLDDIIHAVEQEIIGGKVHLDSIKRYNERYRGE